MKSVLISIQPKWCELIANGKKTVEVRKTRPKLETPFKVYIYATKPRHYFKISKHLLISDESLFLINGKVRMSEGFGVEYEDREYKHLNCKVIGEFVCDNINTIEHYNGAIIEQGCCDTAYTLESSCIENFDDIVNYMGKQEKAYGWHISDFVIYDKPKDLSEFYVEGDCDCMNCKKCAWFDKGNGYNVEDDCNLAYKGIAEHKAYKPIIRPPQSWCYVEELKGE